MKNPNHMPKKLYLVWVLDEPTHECEYYNQYETLEDAVSAEGDNCKVYVANIKYLGTYKKSVKIIKSKKEKNGTTKK